MSPELQAVAVAIKIVNDSTIQVDRLLYVVNWIVSKQLQLSKEFDAVEFYKLCGYNS